MASAGEPQPAVQSTAPELVAGPTVPAKWWALAVLALSQLLVVLDATVVNVALPDAQKALGMSDGDRQWVITAYALTFGALLLLGGRIADFWGRRRTFLVGMAGFAVASAIGGLAQTSVELFIARALQGVFAAMLAPAALSLLQITFPSGKDRAKAFGLYGAIGAGGAAFGLVLGGLLTEYASWRWCLLVNLPVAAVAMVGALRFIPESRAHGDARYDVVGAVLVTLGLGALVFGFTRANEDGWAAAMTLTFLGLAVVLLAAFVQVERTSDHPLLPLRIPLHPSRGGAYLVSLLGGAALFGGLLFLSYYFQLTLNYSPLKAGLASAPLTLAVVVSAAVATGLLPRVGARVLMAIGPIVCAGGMFYLTGIGVTASYATQVLPAQIIIGFGLGLMFVPLSNVALIGVADHDTGAASALVNATQQVGGAVGTALFSTIYATAVTSYLSDRVLSDATQASALVHGYTTAFIYAGALMVVAGVIAFALIRARNEQDPVATTTAAG